MTRHSHEGETMSNRTWRLRGGVGILLASLVCLCVGCNPQSLSMLLMPFADNKVEPEHNLFAGKKELKLVILTRFAEQDLLQCDEIVPTETELPNQLALYFKKRCAENRLKINIVPQSEVRNYLDKEGITREDLSSLTLDIGKHFKADYVLNLNIQSLHLINRKFNPPVYQGRAHIFVSLYKVSASEAEAKV